MALWSFGQICMLEAGRVPPVVREAMERIGFDPRDVTEYQRNVLEAHERERRFGPLPSDLDEYLRTLRRPALRRETDDLPHWVRTLIGEWERSGLRAVPSAHRGSEGELVIEQPDATVTVPSSGPDRIVVSEPHRLTLTYRVPPGPSDVEQSFARVRRCPRCGELHGFRYHADRADQSAMPCICDAISRSAVRAGWP